LTPHGLAACGFCVLIWAKCTKLHATARQRITVLFEALASMIHIALNCIDSHQMAVQSGTTIGSRDFDVLMG